jgi:hypothetical protein
MNTKCIRLRTQTAKSDEKGVDPQVFAERTFPTPRNCSGVADNSNIVTVEPLRRRNQEAYEMKPAMNKQIAKAARAVLCLVVLVVIQGCTTPRSSASGKSWSQIASEEDRAQQLSESPQGDWKMLP